MFSDGLFLLAHSGVKSGLLLSGIKLGQFRKLFFKHQVERIVGQIYLSSEYKVFAVMHELDIARFETATPECGPIIQIYESE